MCRGEIQPEPEAALCIKSVRRGHFPCNDSSAFLALVRMGPWGGGQGRQIWHPGVSVAFEIGKTVADSLLLLLNELRQRDYQLSLWNAPVPMHFLRQSSLICKKDGLNQNFRSCYPMSERNQKNERLLLNY